MEIIALITAALLAVSAFTGSDGEARSVVGVELRGTSSFATGLRFEGTEVGGLSGIAHDRRRGVYYALSDDRSQRDASRFYTLEIDLADGSLDDGDVEVVAVTPLTDGRGDTFEPQAIDPEGITLVGRRRLFISTEGDSRADPPIAPFVDRFRRSGRRQLSLPVPDKFRPDAGGTRGVRFNEGFESLTSTPSGRALYAATETSLTQDGPSTDVGQSSLARILRYDLGDRRPREEYVYVVEPVAEPPEPADAFRVNGLVELLALDDRGTFLALERSFSVGRGNTVRLYEISTVGATDVSAEPTLFPGGELLPLEPVSKRLLLDFADLGLEPDNLEALAFGPPLADGRLPLIVVSDNNFNPDQETQFVLLAVELSARRPPGQRGGPPR